MIIWGSTQYVPIEKRKEPWYQLSVISQWDFNTKPCCFFTYSKTTISFCLYKYTYVSDTESNYELVKELTEEMKQELLNLNYILP